MKKIIWAILPISIILNSCSGASGKLTKTEVESLVKECLRKEGADKEAIKLTIGKDIRLSTDSAKYKKLAEEGFLKLEKLPRAESEIYDSYAVSFTEKAKPFLIDMSGNDALVKTYDIEIEKVGDVIIDSKEELADVRIDLKKTNKTPFSIFSVDNTEFLVKNYRARKAFGEWKFCN